MINSMIHLLLIAGAAMANTPRYKWVTSPTAETYCIRLDNEGHREARVSRTWCPIKDLRYRWISTDQGVRCALISETDADFRILWDERACGTPYDAYYEWEMPDPDSMEAPRCIMKSPRDKAEHIRVAPDHCPAR